MVRLFKAIWFLSVLCVLGNMLWVYAGLPERVIIQETESGRVEGSREFLFYAMVALVLIVNVLVYIVKILFPSREDFRGWFFGLIVTFNIFFVIVMSFIQTYNSGENFNFADISFLLYGAVALVILWALAWPVYSIFKKTSSQHTIS